MLGATLEDNLALSYQAKHSLPIQPSNHTPQYLPKSLENLCPQKTCMCFTYNHQKVEATSMLFNKWHVHTMEYYSVTKRNKLSIMKDMDVS